MNFFKWFLYLIALGAFIWYVFFRPLPSQSTVENTTDIEDTNGTIKDLENDEEDDMYADNSILEETKDNNSSDGSINLNDKYLIVVGSFGVKANADRMLKRVLDSGKEAKLTSIRGLYRVVTASSNDRTDAKELRSHFTHAYHEPGFILER